jgi:hypothetical protein
MTGPGRFRGTTTLEDTHCRRTDARPGRSLSECVQAQVLRSDLDTAGRGYEGAVKRKIEPCRNGCRKKTAAIESTNAYDAPLGGASSFGGSRCGRRGFPGCRAASAPQSRPTDATLRGTHVCDLVSSLSLEKPLLDRLEAGQAQLLHNRSEFVRDMIRERLVERSGTRTRRWWGRHTVYDHHVASRLSEGRPMSSTIITGDPDDDARAPRQGVRGDDPVKGTEPGIPVATCCGRHKGAACGLSASTTGTQLGAGTSTSSPQARTPECGRVEHGTQLTRQLMRDTVPHANHRHGDGCR